MFHFQLVSLHQVGGVIPAQFARLQDESSDGTSVAEGHSSNSRRGKNRSSPVPRPCRNVKVRQLFCLTKPGQIRGKSESVLGSRQSPEKDASQTVGEQPRTQVPHLTNPLLPGACSTFQQAEGSYVECVSRR